MSDFNTLSISRGRIPVTHGSLLQFPDDPIACMKMLRREHGDLAVLEQDGQRLVFVFSPELNHQVLSDTQVFHSRFFAVRGSRNSAQRRVTAGLLSQNGAEHRETRRLLKDVFSKRVLPDYHQTICHLTDDLLSRWSLGSVRDLNSDMVHFMLRMTSALLFGLDDAHFALQLGEMIDRWVHRNHEVGIGALVSGPQFNQKYEELLQMADELEASVQQMFNMHRSRNHDRPNILSLLFQAQGSEQQLTDEHLTGHATLLFAAAHLTTAHTFCWTLFLLAQHPAVCARLHEELNQHISGEVPTLQELEKVTYLDWVIRESMRVMPASAYSQRITAESAQLGSLRLPPGTPVVFSQYMTHHREDIYSEPHRFQPERWASIAPSAYEYLPFGAGPRMCIGAPLAMAEIRAALAMMLKNYHFQIQPNCVVNGQVISTMLSPTTTIPARLISPDEIPVTVSVNGSIHDLMTLPDAAQPAVERRAA
ncbi:MAG: cytochrome P450 [Planctomyces sp.]|nr:cytochrome P450 [Planctomyces sp.]